MTDTAMASRLLEVSELTLTLADGTPLLRGVTLHVDAGETVGLVGESGSGKSLTARAALGLTPAAATLGGSMRVTGREMVGAHRKDVLRVRREGAAMVFQDPRSGINPMRTIGDHMTETMRLVEHCSAADAHTRALDLLDAVRLPDPRAHLRQHPHEFSGGMLQRVMIAGALTSSPQLLICDEPTSALDVTTQADIVAVLQRLRGERGMGMLFITHDLNLAASICDRVYVMHDGVIQEQGSARDVFGNPQAEYTRRLVEATPSLDRTVGPAAAGLQHAGVPAEPAPAPADEPILRVEGLGKSYHVAGRAPLQAVSGASFALARGGALGVVGESGSGKSTLARMIVGLERPDVGDIQIAGRDRLGAAHSRAERLARARSVQMVFQDPYLSLDPRVPVGRAIEDALRLHTGRRDAALRRRVVELLTAVGLEERHASARPRTLSGGQRQRVAIARAVAVDPDVLVMDEATSALDVSVQAQVLDLVADIRRDRALTVVFISHDLTVVRRVCETTLVMRRGRIVEEGPTARLLEQPQHPYTRLLLDSIPRVPAHD